MILKDKEEGWEWGKFWKPLNPNYNDFNYLYHKEYEKKLSWWKMEEKWSELRQRRRRYWDYYEEWNLKSILIFNFIYNLKVKRYNCNQRWASINKSSWKEYGRNRSAPSTQNKFQTPTPKHKPAWIRNIQTKISSPFSIISTKWLKSITRQQKNRLNPSKGASSLS